ncbi:RHS repeat domain-containing protein [Microbacterium resistens]|uniref:hypothetical protein n=1 Tax=Microbacterium resistens TaxID=156977 RepID=UPI00366FF508
MMRTGPTTPRRPRWARSLAMLLTGLLAAGLSVLGFALPAQAAAQDGVYTGTTSDGFDIAVTVEGGAVTDVDTQSWTWCASPDFPGTTPQMVQFIGIPETPIAADGSFSAHWTYDSDPSDELYFEFWFGGVVSDDGVIVNSGSNAADAVMPGLLCEATQFTYTAELDPVAAELSIAPNPATVSQALAGDLTLTGTGFAPESTVTVSFDGDELGTMQTDASGTATSRLTVANAVPGEYEVRMAGSGKSATTMLVIQADPVVNPEIALDPTTISPSDLAADGVTITGTGFPTDDNVSLTFDGSAIVSMPADAQGRFTYSLRRADVAPGAHTVTLTSGPHTVSAELTVTEDPYQPAVTVDPATVTRSALGTTGVRISGTGFPEDADVVLTLSGTEMATLRTDATGAVQDDFVRAGILPASHELRLTSGTWSAATTLTVTEDPVTYDPTASVAPESLTVSELAGSGVTISGEGFPENADVTVAVDGSTVTTVRSDAAGDVSYVHTVSGAATGGHAVALTSGQWSAEASFTVTADPVDYDPTVAVAPSSVTVSELASPGVTITGEGFPENADVVVSVSGTEEATVASNAGGEVSYVFTATDRGTGEHDIVLTSGRWSAATVLTVTADPVDYDPTASASPASLTVSALGATGVRLTGEGFPEDADVVIAVDGADVATVRSSADGALAYTHKAAGAATGVHAVTLTSGRWAAETSFTVTADPVDEDPTVALDPTTLTVSALASSGIGVTGEDFPADAEAEVLFDGQVVDTVTTDADGALVATVVRDGVAPGTYPVTVRSGGEEASADVTVTADPTTPAEVTLSPDEIAAGALATDGVALSAAGLPASTPVRVAFDGVEVARFTSGADGAGSVSFTVSDAQPGAHTVELIQAGERVRSEAAGLSAAAVGDVLATATLTVTEDPRPGAPTLELSTGEVTVGALAKDGVGLAGRDLVAGETVQVLFDGEVVQEATADANGELHRTLTVSGVAPGAHEVSLVQGDRRADAALTVVADPGPTPTPTPTEPAPTPGAPTPGAPAPGPGGAGLPATGLDGGGIAGLVALAALLAVGGGLMVRRRRTA